jgi:GTPase
MRTNDVGLITFKFKYGVEYIEEGQQIMIREGSTKAVGYISKVYSMDQMPPGLVDNYIAD